MAKKSKSCAVTTIRFKTKRGRAVSFRGRSAGQVKNDGDCANKARKFSPEARKMQRLVAQAGRKCKNSGPIGKQKNTACLKAYFRANG